MNAEKKVIKHKLSVLELAEALDNVSTACRQKGVSRAQFYEYKRRFQTHGMEGLRDLPPIAKHRPNTIPSETVEKIVALAMTHPGRDPNYLESLLKADGIQVSFVTIQKLLKRTGLGSRYDRWLAMEKRQAKKPIE